MEGGEAYPRLMEWCTDRGEGGEAERQRGWERSWTIGEKGDTVRERARARASKRKERGERERE
eukprot:4213499-Pleurochrysis_carterae.AAC.1